MKHSAKEVYKNIDTPFGAGDNAIHLMNGLFELNNPKLIYKLLKKYHKVCLEINFVDNISDKIVGAHLKQLILKDCWLHINTYHIDLPLVLKKRFIATIKRHIKRNKYLQ